MAFKIEEIRKDPKMRTRLITFITMLYNFVWALAKILIGLIFQTYFFCISGVSTLLIGVSKSIFYRNDKKENIDVYGKSAIISILIMVLSLVYCLYMGRLFFVSSTTKYGEITAITIAAFSFLELAISIRNLVKSYKAKNILLMSLRSCNIASSFFALVLTQVAILSAVTEVDHSFYNAIGGIVFGALAFFVGLVQLIVSYKYKYAIEKEIIEEPLLESEDTQDKSNP